MSEIELSPISVSVALRRSLVDARQRVESAIRDWDTIQAETLRVIADSLSTRQYADHIACIARNYAIWDEANAIFKFGLRRILDMGD
jgi:hypothetical protein